MYGLTSADTALVRRVIADAEASVNCRIGIGGSLAQRALSPTIAHELASQRLSDVDLLLINIGSEEPATEDLGRHFKLMERSVDNGSWYYGLIHRATGKWVDLFTWTYPGATTAAEFMGTTRELSALESQVLHLARDIHLRSKSRRLPIRVKWQRKLRRLYELQELDRARLESEFAAHRPYFASMYSEAEDVEGYISSALRLRPTPPWRDWLFLIGWSLRKSERLGR